VAIPALFITIPAVLYYGILFNHLANLPMMDDYVVILQFLNKITQLKGATAKFCFLIAAQDHEYKLYFVHGVAWAQFAALGHVNFTQISLLGDSAVLALAWLVWSMFLPDQKDLAKRLALFVPVAWLLFQLGYWETLNWAMASLVNLWVIAFSLATIQCLLRPTRRAYGCGLILYVLAIAALGNGFLTLPVGLLILATRRQYARAVGLLAVSAVCIAAYAYHYDPMSSQGVPHGSVFTALRHMRPDYVIAFVGNASAIGNASPVYARISLAFGAMLVLLFAWMAKRGYARRNPAIPNSVLFVLLTAVGVAGMRSDLGLTQSQSSRYAIYGALLLIFAWSAIAEEFLQNRSEPLLNNNPYLVVTGMVVLFGLCTDNFGYQFLAQRESDTVKWMAAYERTAASQSPEGPDPQANPESDIMRGYRVRDGAILNESIRLHVYAPPEL
jgi:hypothetical protein